MRNPHLARVKGAAVLGFECLCENWKSEVEGDLLFLSVHPIKRPLIRVTTPNFVIPSAPGFPTSRLFQRQRMRLSVESRMKIRRSYDF